MLFGLLSFVFAVEIGSITGSEWAGFTPWIYPEDSSYVVLEAEANIGPFFINGAWENWQQWDQWNRHIPYRAKYYFGAGVRFGVFEFGWLHMCDHPVISSWYSMSPKQGGFDRFYGRVEVRM